MKEKWQKLERWLTSGISRLVMASETLLMSGDPVSETLFMRADALPPVLRCAPYRRKTAKCNLQANWVWKFLHYAGA